MHALVIDDSKAIRGILKKILGQIGFEVAEAANGREGLERVRELGPPDLALVDWNMPEMDGLEFVRAVRSDSRNSGVRLMMVTTENELARVNSALEAGADEYIMKPFTHEVIREKLELLGIAPGP
jgi:two-component system chemotaxis response regulator CheY